MIDPPQIVETTTRQTAIIHVTVARDDIQNVVGPGVVELMHTIAAQGIAPAGPWFTHHLASPRDTFDFEISVPVSAPVAPAERMKPGQWPSMKVAHTIYHGPYAGLGAAWSEFDTWITANGHTPAPDLYECYLGGRESSSDPATWRPELNRPLMD
jgi:effector-binding domain-containing protein